MEVTPNDIISMNPGETLTGTPTFKGEEFFRTLRPLLGGIPADQWLGEGVDAQLMNEAGGGWKNGKIRLVLQFDPSAE